MDVSGCVPSKLHAGLNRRVVETASVGIWSVNSDLVITLWNRFMAKRYGIAANEAVGKSLDDVFPEMAGDSMADHVRNVLASGDALYLKSSRQLTPKLGWREFDVDLEPVKDGKMQTKGVVVYTVDVTKNKRLAKKKKRLRKQLAEEKAFFHAFAERVNVLMASADDHGEQIVWNRHAEEVLGYTREEMLGGRFPFEAIVPEPNERDALLSELLSEEAVRDFELKMRAKNGQEKIVSWSVIRRRDQAGKPEAFFGVGIDITERKRLEEELQRDRERLYSILNNMEECVVLEDLNRRVLFMNDKAKETFGAQDSYFYHCAFPWNKVTWLPRHEDSAEFEVQAADGRWYVFTCSKVQMPGGEEAQLQTARDITARKANDRNIERMAKLTETSTDAIIVVDRDLRIVLWNPGAERMFGYTAREAIGQHHKILLTDTPEEHIADAARKVLEKGELTGEVTFRHKSGRPIHALVSASPIHADGGEFEGFLEFVKDITELRAMQQQLIQAQKLESIGTLAGGIAHDFNNILGAILGYATFLKNRVPDDSPLLPDIKVIEDSARQGAALTKQLLGFARGGKYQPEPVNLNDIVDEALTMLLRTLGGNITVESNLRPDPSMIEADRTQILQVIVNLCINSRDAMPEGGTITVSTRHIEVSEEVKHTCFTCSPGRYVELVVADTGSGMTAGTLERVFEPFFTTKGSSGLGLSMVYGTVKNHNGCVHVDSEPGKGAVFTIRLPALPEVAEEKAQPRPLSAADASGTVLVVDDEAVMQQVLVRMLAETGFSSLVAGSGEEAVEVFRDRKGEIDVVLLDMVMPGMSGAATFDRLRAIDPSVKVLLSSGYSETDAAVAAQRNGALGFLEKPYTARHLAGAIRNALDGQPPPREPHHSVNVGHRASRR